jgi:hypothetical protein
MDRNGLEAFGYDKARLIQFHACFGILSYDAAEDIAPACRIDGDEVFTLGIVAIGQTRVFVERGGHWGKGL